MAAFDRAASAAGKAKLEAAGWVKGHSVMADRAQNGQYGTLFTKGGERFWFNKETFQNLPVRAIIQAPALDIDKLLYKGGPVPANGKLERRIVANLLAHMEAKGWKPAQIFDGDDYVPVTTAIEAMELIFNLDEVSVRFRDASDNEHGVMLVLGNGIDIIADWSLAPEDTDGFHAAMEAFDAEDYA